MPFRPAPPKPARRARPVVLALAMAAALSGCLDQGSGNDDANDETKGHLFLETDQRAIAETGFLGVQVVESPVSLWFTFLFLDEAANNASRVSCTAYHNDTLHLRVHASSASIEARVNRSAGQVDLVFPMQAFDALTWHPTFDVHCDALIRGTDERRTETGTFTWAIMHRLGSRDDAFGVGPFRGPHPGWQDELDDVARTSMETGAYQENLVSPRHDIAAASIWQDDATFWLRVRFAELPDPSAELVWEYWPDGGAEAESSGFRLPCVCYSFSKDSAMKQPGGHEVTAEVRGDVLEMRVERQWLDDREHDAYLDLDVLLTASDEDRLYVDDFAPPPYFVDEAS